MKNIINISKNYRVSLMLRLLAMVLSIQMLAACVETVTDTSVDIPDGEITLEIASPTDSDSIGMGRNQVIYFAEDVEGGEGLTGIELFVNIAGRDAQSLEFFPVTDNPSTTPVYLDTDLITEKFGIDPYQFPGQISYWLTAYSGTREVDPLATDVQSPVFVNRKPVSPANLILRKDDDKIFNLVWDDNSSNEEKFELWRKDGTTGAWFQYLEFQPNTISFTDHVPSTVISYFYRIRAINSHGTSEYSNEAASGLNSPSQLTAVALGASTIQLTWKDNSDDELGFRLERKDPISGVFILVEVLQPNSQEYFDTDLAAATSYTYRIASYSSTAVSGYSNEATAVTFTQDIPGPSFLTADFDPLLRKVVVSWKDNTDEENGTEIERKEGLTGIFQGIGFTDEDQTFFLDDNIEEDKVYYYRARHTTNEGFKTPYSNEDSAYVPALPPEAPTNLQIFTFTQNLVFGLHWEDNSEDEDGFELIRTSIESGATFSRTFPANTTAYNDTLPDPTKDYTYRVRSFKNGLFSDYSNEVTTLEDELTPPSGLTAAQVTNENAVELEWIDNSNNELGFIIERRRSNENDFEILKFVGPDSEYFLDQSGLVSGTVYIYRVQAYNSSNYSDYSNTATIEIDPRDPNAITPPTELTASQLSGQNAVDLAWVDNSDNELGFIIERRKSNESNFSLLTYVAANIEFFRDLTGLQFETVYVYRVKAYSANAESEYSNTATIEIESP